MSLLTPDPTLYGNHTFGDLPKLDVRAKKLQAAASEITNKHLQVMQDSVGTKSPTIPWNP